MKDIKTEYPFLFYKAYASTATLTANPNGNISVDHFVSGDDKCWYGDSEDFSEHMKSIIIGDPDFITKLFQLHDKNIHFDNYKFLKTIKEIKPEIWYYSDGVLRRLSYDENNIQIKLRDIPVDFDVYNKDFDFNKAILDAKLISDQVHILVPGSIDKQGNILERPYYDQSLINQFNAHLRDHEKDELSMQFIHGNYQQINLGSLKREMYNDQEIKKLINLNPGSTIDAELELNFYDDIEFFKNFLEVLKKKNHLKLTLNLKDIDITEKELLSFVKSTDCSTLQIGNCIIRQSGELNENLLTNLPDLLIKNSAVNSQFLYHFSNVENIPYYEGLYLDFKKSKVCFLKKDGILKTSINNKGEVFSEEELKDLIPAHRLEYTHQEISVKDTQENTGDYSLQNSNHHEESVIIGDVFSSPTHYRTFANPYLKSEYKKIIYLHPKFKTWHNSRLSDDMPIKDLSLEIFEEKGKNCLIEFENKNFLEDYSLYLRLIAKSYNVPIFYADSPSSLSCMKNMIIFEDQDGSSGIVKQAPCGSLYDFLKEEHTRAPVLVINYSNFENRDFVRFNTIIDESDCRTVDSVPLLPTSIVVGLVQKNMSYKGSDFFSRFQTKVPAFTEKLNKEVKNYLSVLDNNISPELISKEIVIECYKSSQWKNLLLGFWTIKGDEFVFSPGQLISAFDQNPNKNLKLIIQNPPELDETFREFWNNLKINSFIELYGKKINTSQIRQIVEINNSEFNFGDVEITQSDVIDPKDHLITRENFFTLFHRYDIDNLNKMYMKPGLLEQNRDGLLQIYISNEISDMQWKNLLDYKKKYKISLKIKTPKKAILPEQLKRIAKDENIEASSINADDHHKKNMIVSFDQKNLIDGFIEKYAERMHIDKIITVTEVESHEILERINPQFSKKEINFFKYESSIIEAVKRGETVLLKGEFKKNIIDTLLPLFIDANSVADQKGRILIFTHQKDMWPDIVNTVSFSSFLQDIKNQYGNLPISYPLSLKNNNEAITDIKLYDNEQRLKALESQLEKEPCVVIYGKTGVGKSAFVQTLSRTDKVNVFMEMPNISKWASMEYDKESKHILILDEFNLIDSDLTCFEDMYNCNPSIYYKGVYYPLTNQHKVIFIGNPTIYGGERREQKLLKNKNIPSLNFSSMPGNKLYELLSKQIDQDGNLKNELEKLVETYTAIEKFEKPEDIILTPRELQMMGLMLKAKKSSIDDQDIADVIFLVVDPLLHEKQKPFLYQHLETQYNWRSSKEENQLIKDESGKFLLTESRIKPYEKLKSFFEVCKLRSENKELDSLGLSALKIEGMPGTGKSKFVIEFLKENNFDNYIYIAASTSIDVKKQLLDEAFNKGSIVIIEEANSSVALERSLNSYLMGFDLEGRLPETPGFSLIITQNPPSMQGRISYSEALKHRMFHSDFPLYKKEELVQIMKFNYKHLDDGTIDYLVQTWQNHFSYAYNLHLFPQPTYRELFHEANSINEARTQQEMFSSSYYIEFSEEEKVINVLGKESVKEVSFFKQPKTIIPQKTIAGAVQYDKERGSIDFPKNIFVSEEYSGFTRLQISAHGGGVNNIYFTRSDKTNLPIHYSKLTKLISDNFDYYENHVIGIYMWSCIARKISISIAQELYQQGLSNIYCVFHGNNYAVGSKAGYSLSNNILLKNGNPDPNFKTFPKPESLVYESWHRDNKLVVFLGKDGITQITPYNRFKKEILSKPADVKNLIEMKTPYGLLRELKDDLHNKFVGDTIYFNNKLQLVLSDICKYCHDIIDKHDFSPIYDEIIMQAIYQSIFLLEEISKNTPSLIGLNHFIYDIKKSHQELSKLMSIECVDPVEIDYSDILKNLVNIIDSNLASAKFSKWSITSTIMPLPVHYNNENELMVMPYRNAISSFTKYNAESNIKAATGFVYEFLKDIDQNVSQWINKCFSNTELSAMKDLAKEYSEYIDFDPNQYFDARSLRKKLHKSFNTDHGSGNTEAHQKLNNIPKNEYIEDGMFKIHKYLGVANSYIFGLNASTNIIKTYNDPNTENSIQAGYSIAQFLMYVKGYASYINILQLGSIAYKVHYGEYADAGYESVYLVGGILSFSAVHSFLPATAVVVEAGMTLYSLSNALNNAYNVAGDLYNDYYANEELADNMMTSRHNAEDL